MSDSDSAPSTHELIRLARLDFAGILITTLGYGIYLVIAAAALRLLLKRRASSRGRNMTLAYTILMLIITTVAFGTIAKTNTILLVDSVYDPHAADALFCSPTNIATSVFTTLQIYGSDALLLYRAYVILEGNWWYLAFPCLVYLGTIGVGIAANLLCASKDLGGTLNLPTTTDLGTPLYSLTVSLNILTTLLIGIKLLSYRSRVVRAGVGAHDALRELTSVVGILTESAALYSVTGIIYIALYVRNDPLQSPFSNLFGVMTFLSPALIILRVALGVAYQRGSTGRGTEQTLRAAESGEPRGSHATGGVQSTVAGSSIVSPYGFEKAAAPNMSTHSVNAYEMINVPLAGARRA